jgi:hypothetical protein
VVAVPEHWRFRVGAETEHQIQTIAAAVDLQLKVALVMTLAVSVTGLDQQGALRDRCARLWGRAVEAQRMAPGPEAEIGGPGEVGQERLPTIGERTVIPVAVVVAGVEESEVSQGTA